MYKAYFFPSFQRNLKKIIKKHPELTSKIHKQIKTLEGNPKSSLLRLHKLSGRNNWPISVTRDIGIIFSIKKNTIICMRIGTHKEVY